MRLKLFYEGHERFEMTVVEMICSLMRLPPDDDVPMFGATTFILRERCDSSGGDAILPAHRQWLELDARQ
jgi:hypothetical protein